MKKLSLRPFAAELNWGRALLALVLVAGFSAMLTEPAFAAGGGSAAFGALQTTMTTQTGAAIGVARTVLLTGAVLSLIVGLAPMLWGQVKTKWIVTALVACVLFGLSALFVGAFAGTTPIGTMTGQQQG